MGEPQARLTIAPHFATMYAMKFHEFLPANENETLQRRVLRLKNSLFRQEAFTDENDKEKVALFSTVLDSLLQPGFDGTISDEYVGKEIPLVFVDKEGVVQRPSEALTIPSNPEELLNHLNAILSPTEITETLGAEAPLGHFNFFEHAMRLKKHEDVASEFEKLQKQNLGKEDHNYRLGLLQSRMFALLHPAVLEANMKTLEDLSTYTNLCHTHNWLKSDDFETIKLSLLNRARVLNPSSINTQ